MMDLKIDQVKGLFFDRGKVIKAANSGLRRGLSKLGAFIRTRAISSMLRHAINKGFGIKSKVSNRQGISEPGEPPFPHLGLIVRALFFAWDAANRSVVIGPALLSGRSFGGGSQVLRNLEYGGPGTVLDKGKVKAAMFRPRPFMRPAADEEMGKLPECLTDCIQASDAN